MFRLETFVQEISFENFRLGYFVWEFLFGIVRFEIGDWIVRLGSSACGFSFESFRLTSSVWNPSFGNCRVGSFVLGFSPWKLRLKAFLSKYWLETFRLGKLSLGSFRSGSSVWDLWFWIFGFGSLAWALWLGIFGLRF